MTHAIQQDVDLSALNSFGVPARAAWFVPVESADDVLAARQFAADRQLPVLVLGEGSNILFVHDFPGLVLHPTSSAVAINNATGQVTAEAGANWHELVRQCMNSGLHGLENLALIPGTVGAAPVQNIGAYGAELAEFFVSLQAVNLLTGEVETLDREACEFAYRSSVFKRDLDTPRVILSVTLALSSLWQPNLGYAALRDAIGTSEPSPQTVFDTVCQVRRSKLPDPAELGNAGSFFKNPVVSQGKYDSLQASYPDLPAYDEGEGLVKIPAAWLLEQAGWKGKRQGAAGVHEQHALVLVNHGQATGEDLFMLAQAMSASVLERFGIALNPEVRIL